MKYNNAKKTFSFPPKKANKTALIGMSLLCSTVPAIAGWQVEWIDKFEGSSVNWDNWTAQTNANYNNEVQCYTDDDSSDEKNYDVSDGVLKIIARKKSNSCTGLNGITKSWTSGRLNSKDKSEFLYGRIESRIRFQNLEGGTWPAFWMLENRIMQQPIKGDDDYSYWPNSGAGEIDVWEWFSNSPDSYITNFFNAESCAALEKYYYIGGGPDVQEWHNYAIEWAQDEISFYIDEILVVTQDVSNCTQYEEPMFVLLNVAMGGDLGGSIDSNLEIATLEVDYVAHCSATDANSAIYCNEETAIVDEPIDTEDPDPTDTETPDPTDTETPDPTDTETPDPTDTETPDPSDTEAPDPSDTEDGSNGGKNKGGSMGGSLLLCLGLTYLFRRKKNVT